ncbi:MAG: ATP-binding protein [Bacillota bacterium]
MFRSTFFRRLFIPYLVLIAIVITGMGGFAALRLRSAYLDSRRQALHEQLRLTAELISDDLQNGRFAALNQHIRSLGEKIGCRITVIRSDGTVVADNWADPATMENHATRPEILNALQRGEAFDTRYSGTIHSNMLYLASAMDQPSEPTYYLRLAVLVTNLRHELRLLYTGLAGVAILAMASAGAIVFHFARRHTNPIIQLTQVAQAIAQGDLHRRTLSDEKGEIGTLARATNTMADSIHRLLTQAEQGRAELLAILASMSDGVIATDNQQRIRVANESAGKLLGFHSDQAIGKPLWQVVRIDSIIKAIGEVLESGQSTVLQAGLIAGRNVEVRIQRFPPTGEAHGLVVVAHDTTQIVRYQELRKEFVANVSHELRTPLSVINGFVETLADGALQDPQRGPQYLATIQRHMQQLINLVNDLLALSRLESQPELPRRSNVDLSAAVNKVADLLLPAAQNKSQTLTVDARPVPAIVGDPDYLERAIANFIDNAIKYTPEGGHISVSTRSDADKVILEVSDNGIGIPQEDLPRLFERFYRVDRSRSRDMGGTGLGLSIVKHIAQVHGGSVNVESTIGKGSTFRLLLPLATPSD